MSVTPDTIHSSRTRRAAWCSARFPLALGVTLALLILGLCAAMGWWTNRIVTETRAHGERERALVMGHMLAQIASARLGANDATSLWLELRQLASAQGLSTCKVMLPDGRVLVDGLGSQASGTALPQQWDNGAPPLDAQRTDHGWEVRAGAEVPGRGLVLVLLITSDSTSAAVDVRTGIAAFGALGLLVAAGVARAVHGRLSRLDVLRGAVKSAAKRGGTAESLSLSPRFGPDAALWNQIVQQLEEVRLERVKAQLAERESSGSQRDSDGAAALDGLWIGVFLLDNAGRIEYCNGAACLMLGGTRDQLAGALAREILPPQAIELARGSASTARSVEVELARGKQEKTLLRFTSRVLGHTGETTTMLVAEDITQQRMADDSRNAFVTQATHELRTPLTNMRLYLETLVEEGDSDPAVKSRCLNVLSGAVRRLERVVSDMLSVSEIEAGSLKLRRDDVKPEELFEELAADFKAQSEDKEIALVFELPPKMATLDADRDKLVLSLHNLIGNALKYTPAGGEVRVRVEQGPSELVVHVSDNGIGIKEDECELIFERFYRAKDRRVSGITGSGLGLALSRQIARLHGGDVTVSSVIDRGSTFTMRIPCNASALSKAA